MNFPIDPLIVDIPDFPGYQISELGTVYNKKTGYELKNTLDGSNGYYKVTIKKNEKIFKKQYIHRLLAFSFVPNPLGKKEVDHINRVRGDNDLKNLRWVSHSENNTNVGIQKNNSSGFSGIAVRKRKINDKIYTCWSASLMKNYKLCVKQFPYTEEGLENAKKWYLEKKQELHTYN